MGLMQTEYEFTLPVGYLDDAGTLHKEGRMRMATAADEILPLRDHRVKENEEYLTIILLSRVISGLGTLRAVDTRVVERLFVPDIEYLKELYKRVNQMPVPEYKGTCPHCGESFSVPINFFQESLS